MTKLNSYDKFNSDLLLWARIQRRNGVALIVNERVQNAIVVYNLKNDRKISVHFQGKPFNITVIQAYAPTTDAKEAEVNQFYEDLEDLLELIPKRKKILCSSLEIRMQK